MLYNANLDADIDATVEPTEFVIAREADAEPASITATSAVPLDSLPGGTPSVASQDVARDGDTSARRRNRDKKRKRREREDAGGELAVKRRIQFLARATLLKSEDYVVRNGRRAKSGYVGIVDRGLDFAFLDGPAARRIKRLLQHQYELIEFDKLPIMFESRSEYPICDSKGKIFAVVLGWPEGWARRTEAVNRAMEQLQETLAGCKVPPNRRGPFAAYAVGYSYGGGQTQPMPFKRTKREREAINEFLSDPDVEAVFKYVGGELLSWRWSMVYDPQSTVPTGVMTTWFPQHTADYQSCLETYQSHDSALTPPSSHLPFPALTINAGRITVCLPHRDSPNDAAGVCLDWVLGSFDAQRGGQLVLHEAQKILALEPGRVILFPSAIITHETIPIAEGEWRSGVTGYAAGGLWRYMAQGFMTRGAWEMTGGSEEALRQHDDQGEERWKAGLARFKTLQELIHWWTRVAEAAAAQTERVDNEDEDLSA